LLSNTAETEIPLRLYWNLQAPRRFRTGEVGRMRAFVGKVLLYLLVWLSALAGAMAWLGVRPRALGPVIALFLGMKVVAALSLGSFRELWRHTSLEDLVSLVEGALASTVVLALLLAVVGRFDAPPLLALTDGALTLALIAPLRILPRIVSEVLLPRLRARRRTVVLAGRPERVDLELRRMQRSRHADRVVGLVLEGPPLDGAFLRRLRVLSREELARMLERRQVQEVLLVPPASEGFTSGLEKLCAQAKHGVCRSAPSLLALSSLNTVAEQLLERPPAALADSAVREAVRGRRVLVTGAGGSIGAELARQLYILQPHTLVLADRSENALFHADRALAGLGDVGCDLQTQVIDIRDTTAVQRLFARYRPELVFHAAAHKHVPLMERHPAEAVLNNVGGTRTLLEAAAGFGAHGFVFVSTDKAVRPSSIMGATKRLGELLVASMSRASLGRYVTVRFGNVLGSNGSVLPIFVEQIQRGGPVTVTHPQMTRFFMSIAEACQLVLRAATQGASSELFVLDMGRPMRIVDLASRVIERAGLRPGEDVPIVFTGPRPGEKLAEELMSAEESRAAQVVDGVWTVKLTTEWSEPPAGRVEALLELARAGDDHGVRELLGELVPEYVSSATPSHVEDDPTDREALLVVAMDR
jgi:FlaA1/EpsC-like NDP-sugar epimerase